MTSFGQGGGIAPGGMTARSTTARNATQSTCVMSALGPLAGLGLLLVASLAGCRSADELIPARCLPGEDPVVQAGMGDAGALRVYLDVSQSSTNFGRAGGESAYRDMIAWLMDLRSEFSEARSYGFAQRIAEIDRDVFVRAARGEVNPCRGCGFRESRLDDVLAQVAAAESHAFLDVVITDLWLDNSEMIGSARLALQGPIRSILAGGRAIGILGVVAPYTGPVYDVPGRGGASTIPAGRVRERPLFVLVIGPPGQVGAMARRLAGEVFVDTAMAEHRFTLFTPRLAATGPARHRLVPTSPAVGRAYILAIEGADVPGFLIDRRDVDLAAPAEGDGVETGPALAAPIAVAEGRAPAPAAYDLGVRAWTLVPPEPSAACDADAWVPFDVGGALQVTTGAGGSAIGLDVSHPDLLALRPGEIAMIRYRATVGDLEPDGTGTDWLDEWGFDAEDARALAADPPSLFPALNLAEFGRLLTRSMEEQVTGETVARGSVLLSAR